MVVVEDLVLISQQDRQLEICFLSAVVVDLALRSPLPATIFVGFKATYTWAADRCFSEARKPR